MKRFALALCLAASMFAAEPAADFPAELRLTSGIVLHKASVVRWTADSVVVRHAGGVDPVPFRFIVTDQLASVQAARAAGEKAAATPRAISGQVFITTAGAGPYKFSGDSVKIYPMSAYDTALATVAAKLYGKKYISIAQRAAEWTKALADTTPIATAVTDGDGKYSLTLPNQQPAFLFCTAWRILTDATEHHLWLITSLDPNLQLDGTNEVEGLR